MVLYGIVWYCMVCYGMLWYGMAWHGMAWYGMVRYGIVCVSFKGCLVGVSAEFYGLTHICSAAPGTSSSTRLNNCGYGLPSITPRMMVWVVRGTGVGQHSIGHPVVHKLDYTMLYCTILYYTILYYTILYYTVLYYPILSHPILS